MRGACVHDATANQQERTIDYIVLADINILVGDNNILASRLKSWSSANSSTHVNLGFAAL